MGERLRAEQIYDAAIDDDAFEQLATLLAQAVGARSAVFHWKDIHDETEQVSYSGYFSNDQMEAYDHDFTDADLWSAAVRDPARINRVWNCDRLVAAREYENGRLYNEWIRPMGDDTFHALGGALRTPKAFGEIGFHRGKTQPAFGEEEERFVEEALVHLRRMVDIRSKLVVARRVSGTVSASLDVLGHAVLTLDPQGRLIHSNLAGESLLRRGDGLKLRNRQLRACQAGDQQALQAAFDRAIAADGPQASGVLVRRSGGRPYELSILSASVGDQRQIVVVVTDRDSANAGLHERIRDLFGLTSAEAHVAERLALGQSPGEIAERRGVSAATVQTQVKTIFLKVGCRRQSELVAMIGSLPRLRSANDSQNGDDEAEFEA